MQSQMSLRCLRLFHLAHKFRQTRFLLIFTLHLHGVYHFGNCLWRTMKNFWLGDLRHEAYHRQKPQNRHYLGCKINRNLVSCLPPYCPGRDSPLTAYDLGHWWSHRSISYGGYQSLPGCAQKRHFFRIYYLKRCPSRCSSGSLLPSYQ